MTNPTYVVTAVLTALVASLLYMGIISVLRTVARVQAIITGVGDEV